MEDTKAAAVLPDSFLLMHEARRGLLMLLDGHSGSKCLVLESALGGMINRVLSDGHGPGTSALKERGVVHIQELHENMSDGPDPPTFLKSVQHVIYLIRPSIQHTMRVARHVKGDITTSSKRNSSTNTGNSNAIQRHKVYFVPHTSLPCEQVCTRHTEQYMCGMA